MRKFEENPSCPMCGKKEMHKMEYKMMASGDHISRKCERCGYAWFHGTLNLNEEGE